MVTLDKALKAIFKLPAGRLGCITEEDEEDDYEY